MSKRLYEYGSWVQKQGQKTFDLSWKKRYLVLRTDSLCYYEDQPKNEKALAKTKGEIDYGTIKKVYANGDAKLHDGAYFNVETEDRTYHFYVEPKKTVGKWIDLIEKRRPTQPSQKASQTPASSEKGPQGPATTGEVKQPNKKAPLPSPVASDEMTPQEKQILVEKMEEAKRLAVQFNREGQKDKAIQCLNLYKEFKAKLTDDEPTPLTGPAPSNVLQDIDQKFQQQNNHLKDMAVKYKSTNLKLAGQYVALLKKGKAEHSTFIQYAKDPTLDTPTFRIETEQIQAETNIQDLKENELRIIIVEADLPDSASIQAAFGYPDRDNPQQIASPKLNKGHSIPKWEWKTHIERKKIFQGFIEKKKIAFEAVHSGLLSSSSLGKTDSLKLDTLLTKCQMEETLPFKNGKKQIGSVKIQIQLYRPVNGPELISTPVQMIKLDPPKKKASSTTKPVNPVPAQTSTQTTVTTTTPKPIQTTATTPKPIQTTATTPKPTQTTATTPKPTQTTATTPKPTQTTATTPTAKSTPDEPSAEEAELNDPNKMVSNDAMEWEIERLQKEKNKLLAQKITPPDDIDTHITQLQTKLIILQNQVESGQIPLESYLDILSKDARRKKELAISLKNQGKLELAGRALELSKVIQNEWTVSQE